MFLRCTILKIESASPAGVDCVVQFLRNQHSPNLVIRDRKEYLDSAKRGWLIKVGTPEGKLAAVGALFPMTGYDTEMGNAAVDKNEWRGYGLHRLLIEIRTAIFVDCSNGYDRLFTAVDSTNNQESLRNLIAAGFTPLAEPSQEFFKPCSTCVKRQLHQADRCCCKFYYLPEDAQRKLVRQLLARGNTVLLQNKRGQEVEIQIEITALRDPLRRQKLESFAASDCIGVTR